MGGGEEEKKFRARRKEFFSCQKKREKCERQMEAEKHEYIFGALMNDYKLERKFA